MIKKAFTLAEVLITLTIIGVIAAITIPNLMQKYTKHQYVVGLKKAYAELSNAIKIAPLTEGCSAGDYDCLGIFEEKNKATNIDGQEFAGSNANKLLYILSKNLKTQKLCLNNTGECSWIKTYQKSALADIDQYTANGLITDSGVLYRTFFFSSSEGLSILVDVNGLKEPNTYGRDKFVFSMASQTQNNIPQGTILPTRSRLEFIYHNNANNYWAWGGTSKTRCKTENIAKNAYSAALSCTGRVLEENAMNY